MQPVPVQGPEAWLAADLQNSSDWWSTFSNADLVELDRALQHALATRRPLRELTRNEPLASVAILTPSSEVSAAYYEGLYRSDLPDLRRVEKQDFTFAPGIEISEIEQAKGLEFDYVILVDVCARNLPDTPAARRLLHVGATRAVHQLWLTSVGTPSPLVIDLGS